MVAALIRYRIMPYDTLPEFLSALEAAGELRRIKAPVDPVLEITEIADRVSKVIGNLILADEHGKIRGWRVSAYRRISGSTK
jgi:UbiD family decarboxylase